MEFGKQLRLLRKEKNLTLRELEEQTGISYSALGKYERNERQPDFGTLEKLADHFDVSLDWLLGQTSIRNKSQKVERDISKRIEEFKNDLILTGELSFEGEPMTDEAKEMLLDSMELLLKQVQKANKYFLNKNDQTSDK